jgi:FkbM family methyltransferase
MVALKLEKPTKSRSLSVLVLYSCALLFLAILFGQGVTDLVASSVGSSSQSSQDRRVEAEIKRGLELLANPDKTPTYVDPHYQQTAAGAGPLRQVIIRERMGIVSSTAETWFDTYLLPLMKKKALLVDVGANIGQFTIPIANLGHTVISFEPNQAACATLKANVAKTDFQSNVEVHCAAASNTQETKTFRKADGGISTSFHEITADQAKQLKTQGKEGELEQMESKTIDSVVGSSRDVFMLKTDTQGYEMSVLSGATTLLQSGRVKFLLIEFSYGLLKQAHTVHVDLLNFVAEQGYVCSYLGYHGLLRTDPKAIYGQVDSAPYFPGSRLSVGFEEFVASLQEVNLGKSGWTDLICWKSCSF